MPQQCAQQQQKVYRQRHPEKTPFYSVLFHHFDRFVGEYDLRFEKHCGAWRPVIARVVEKYLDCGILKNGFARVRRPNCKNVHTGIWSFLFPKCFESSFYIIASY